MEHRWIENLSEEDLAFVKRFILASGSLKEVAKVYGITYPTVRLRLDRLIAKIEVFESQAIQSQFERVARALFAEGKLDASSLKQLLEAFREETSSQAQ